MSAGRSTAITVFGITANGCASPKRVPVEKLEQVLQLYREKDITTSTCSTFTKACLPWDPVQLHRVKTALQEAGLAEPRKKPGSSIVSGGRDDL